MKIEIIKKENNEWNLIGEGAANKITSVNKTGFDSDRVPIIEELVINWKDGKVSEYLNFEEYKNDIKEEFNNMMMLLVVPPPVPEFLMPQLKGMFSFVCDKRLLYSPCESIHGIEIDPPKKSIKEQRKRLGWKPLSEEEKVENLEQNLFDIQYLKTK